MPADQVLRDGGVKTLRGGTDTGSFEWFATRIENLFEECAESGNSMKIRGACENILKVYQESVSVAISN